MRADRGAMVAALLAAFAWPWICARATAQSYPAKPVRIVVGFTAGGPADTMARIVARRMSELGGQPVVVDNRPGANGFLAGDFVAKSPGDGHAAWFSSASALSFSKYLYAKPLLDPERELALVTLAVSVPQIFVVHPSLPAKSMRDLAQLAARRPGQLNISVINLGGLVHLGVELFKLSAGVKMTNVQYKGGAPALVDLIGGHIEAGLFDVPAVIGYLPTGKVRALAVTSAERVKQVAAVPTTTEAGYPSVRTDSWYGVAVSAATPAELVQRVNKLWIAALRSPDTESQLLAIGTLPVGSSVEEFQKFRAAESRKWGELIRKINLRLE